LIESFVMPFLKRDLIFVERSEGSEKRITFPAGTPILPTTAKTEEAAICEKRVIELSRRGEDWVPMTIGGKPRFILRSDVCNQLKDVEHATDRGRRADMPVEPASAEYSHDDAAVSGGQGSSDLAGGNFPSNVGQGPVDDPVAERADVAEGSEQSLEPVQLTGRDLLSGEGGVGPESVLRGDNVRTLERCGIVVIIDFMNVLSRHFHGQEPSEIHGVRGLLDTSRQVIEKLCPEFILFAGEGGYAERLKLYPQYKAGREEKSPELGAQIRLAEDALEALGWPLITYDDWEADDVIASLVAQLQAAAIGVVVVSGDKDLLQLLGMFQTVKVYRPWDGGRFFTKPMVVDKFGVTVEQLGDYLALVGDTSDRIPGVAGVGEKTASKLLNEFGSLDEILDAASLGNITGAIGKKVSTTSARESARLSRRLVQLNSALPIPAGWQDWPCQEPRLNWLESLREMGLGAPAQKLTDVLPETGSARDGLSAICWGPGRKLPERKPATKADVSRSLF